MIFRGNQVAVRHVNLLEEVHTEVHTLEALNFLGFVNLVNVVNLFRPLY